MSEITISPFSFESALSPGQKRILFKENVQQLDIEVTSQCNRKCDYCPNSIYDRYSENSSIDNGAYNVVIDELASISYCKRINFVGCNEPLMHLDSALSALRYARRRLPGAELCIFTNGDYLTKDVFDTLVDEGLNGLYISHHLASGASYNDEKVLARIERTSKKLALPLVMEQYAKDAVAYGKLPHPRIEVHAFQYNYATSGHYRGGLLKDMPIPAATRTAACYYPVTQFNIHYNGDVVPCCTLYAGAPEHKEAVVGVVGKQSIFDIYAGEKYIEWRKGLWNNLKKSGVCAHCNQNPSFKVHDAFSGMDVIDEVVVAPDSNGRPTLSSHLKSRIASRLKNRLSQPIYVRLQDIYRKLTRIQPR